MRAAMRRGCARVVELVLQQGAASIDSFSIILVNFQIGKTFQESGLSYLSTGLWFSQACVLLEVIVMAF